MARLTAAERAKQLAKLRKGKTTKKAYTPPTPPIVSQPPTPTITDWRGYQQEEKRKRQATERRAEEEAYARGMQQMLAQQGDAYSPATASGVGQIPTGLQQAGYQPGAYVSYPSVYGTGTARQLSQMYPGEAFMPTEMAKISRDVAIGITKGKWPFRVAQPIVERWGLSADEASKWLQASGYLQESPGIWRQGEVTGGPGAGGGGGGYGGGGYGGGRWPSLPAVSTRASTSGRLINWRIGI